MSTFLPSSYFKPLSKILKEQDNKRTSESSIQWIKGAALF